MVATSGTTESVAKRKRIVEDDMCVTNAKRQDIGGRIAASPPEMDAVVRQPRYLRRTMWADPEVSSFISPTVCSTLTDDPLPRPPPEEFDNHDAVSTIECNPHLFRITTPIKVDRFEELIVGYPNRPFVESVCTSLRDGFWPWAHTQRESYPVMWDFSDRPPKTEHEAGFLRDQRDLEIAAGRYSEGFGSELLPGMYSTPVHAVPKPHSEKLRLVNDHSAGTFPLNSMIAREEVG